MNETVNQEQKTAEQQPERTFTQTEMDAIIRDRLSRERSKYADYDDIKAKAQKFDEAEEASKSELQKVTERANALQAQLDTLTKANAIRSIRDKVAAETGVPSDLLSGDTEEACKAQAEKLIAFKGTSPGYPSTRDAGEVSKVGGAATRDQFASWLNERIK